VFALMMLEPSHVPFALSLVPFLGVGIGLPVTVQDWIRGRLTQADAVSLPIGFVIVVAWYWAILQIVKSRRRAGREKFLGRALDSWVWSPPITFVVGVVCGLSLLFTGML
jgi:hypothetical protein